MLAGHKHALAKRFNVNIQHLDLQYSIYRFKERRRSSLNVQCPLYRLSKYDQNGLSCGDQGANSLDHDVAAKPIIYLDIWTMSRYAHPKISSLLVPTCSIDSRRWHAIGSVALWKMKQLFVF